MINTFKGLVGDTNIIDLISSYSFPHDPQSQQDNGSIFIQPPMDLYNSVADDLQSGLLLTQLNQDRTKTPSSPKKDYHLGKKVQAGSKGSLLGPRTDQDLLDDDDDDDEDGDKEGDDGDSDDDDKKRGKYRTYTDEEKAHIIKFMMKHGIQQTLEIFSGGEHKITKRKLKSWLESQNKIKGVKGRKSNDPARDRALNEWCMDFQNEHGRPPSRKEATQKALELSGDPNFQASKGWLDKFSRKYNIEFTPLKIIPPRGKKKVKTNGEGILGEPVSAASTQASGLIESLSPLKEAKVKISDMDAKKIVSPAAIAKDVKQADGSNFMRVNPAFNKPMYQQPQQQMPQHQHQHQHQHQQQHQHQHQHQHQQQNAMPVQPQPQMPQQQQQQQGQQYPPMPANDGSYPSMDGGVYSAISNLDGQQGQGFGYPFNYPSLDYSMPYGLNYPKMYPRKSYPMNYPMNLPMNYPNFAENLQLLQQMMMKKESDVGMEKTQFS